MRREYLLALIRAIGLSLGIGFFCFGLADLGERSWAQTPFNAAIQDVPPGWVLKPTPAIDCYFAKGTYYNCPLQQSFSLTRASPEPVIWNDGHLSYTPSGVLAISDLGLQIWESRENYALYSSDFTQSGSWTATNVTAAKNATGPDRVANSASTLTATANNATILQAITLASQVDTFSVYVLCVTCTGTISAAEYPSGTPSFTALSSSNCTTLGGNPTASNLSTTHWVRCSLEATVLNPVIGFQFANSGDSIIMFGAQLEPGAFASPLCPTTSGTCTRAADIINPIGFIKTRLSTFPQSTYISFNIAQTGASNQYLLSVSDGTANNRIESFNTVGNQTIGYRDATSGTAANPATSSSFTLAKNSAVARSVAIGADITSLNGEATTSSSPAALPVVSQANLGLGYNSLGYLDGNVRELSVFRNSLTSAQTMALADNVR